MLNYVLREHPSTDSIPKAALLQYLQYEYEVRSPLQAPHAGNCPACVPLPSAHPSHTHVAYCLQNIEGQDVQSNTQPAATPFMAPMMAQGELPCDACQGAYMPGKSMCPLGGIKQRCPLLSSCAAFPAR